MNRIQFLEVKVACPLSELLIQTWQLSHERAHQLIFLGAIYCNFVRVQSDITVLPKDVLRCHLEPRRFTLPSDWNEMVMQETDDFLVVNKPAGIPTQASLDNRVENLLTQLMMHTKQLLFITHRLDVGTGGLIVLAKSRSFQAKFNSLLEHRKVVKVYEAVTTGPALTPGNLHHWMMPSARAPKVLSPVEKTNWKACHLEILSARVIDQPTIKIDFTNLCSSPPYEFAPGVSTPFEVEMRSSKMLNHYKICLHTGRTHQIRAQMAFEKNPILGDSLYGAQLKNKDPENYALRCTELLWVIQGQTFHQVLPSLIP